MELTLNDIEILLEAMEAWENKSPRAAEMSATLMLSMFSKQSNEETQQELKRLNQLDESEKKLRKEQSVILRAKLIQMRDHAMVGGIAGELGGHDASAA